MRRGFAPVLALLWLLSGCDGEPEELGGSDASVLPGPGTPGTVGGSAPGGSAGSGGTVGPGGTGGPGGTVGPGGVTGIGQAGGGAPDAGLPGGSTDGGPSSEAGSGPGPSVSGPLPVIPPHTMPCPNLQSGKQMIMGLEVNIYAGPTSDSKGPLLFFWHGTSGNGEMATFLLPPAMREEILAQGGIIVAPTDGAAVREGLDVTFLLNVWYTGTDLDLADLVTSCAVENHNIDARRVYAIGWSAGGLLAGTMAYHRSSYLAASVPNSGGIVPVPGLGYDVLQDPKHIPSVMTLHGAAGTDVLGIDFAVASLFLDNGLREKGGFAIDCDHGGGHCEASRELLMASWQFMQDHPFGVSPEPYSNGLPPNFPSYCEIVK